jgi:hypothetical protein
MVKLLALTNNLILISKIEEISSELGEPDCKITNPYVVASDQTMVPFLTGYTSQDVFMISSDKILTLADPKPTLLEKYQDLIK